MSFIIRLTGRKEPIIFLSIFDFLKVLTSTLASKGLLGCGDGGGEGHGGEG